MTFPRPGAVWKVPDSKRPSLWHVDYAYDIEVEIMPDFEPVDVSTLSLERLVYRSSDEELAAALAEVVAQNRTFEPREGEDAKAQDGDPSRGITPERHGLGLAVNDVLVGLIKRLHHHDQEPDPV